MNGFDWWDDWSRNTTVEGVLDVVKIVVLVGVLAVVATCQGGGVG